MATRRAQEVELVHQIALILVLLCVVGTAPGLQAALPDPTIFLNIDCGSMANFVHSNTSLTWESDEKYIAAGVSANTRIDSGVDHQFNTLRYFNDSRRKNCYHLPVQAKYTYMLRAEFLQGYYKGTNISTPTNFSVSIDTMVVTNLSITIEGGRYSEVTYLAQGNTTFLCLIRGPSNDDPFITSIVLRRIMAYPALATLYIDNYYYAVTKARYNFGGNELTRYPQDVYDRYWDGVLGLEPLPAIKLNSTSPLQMLSTAKIMTYGNSVDAVYQTTPQNVLQTGLTTTGDMTLLLPSGWRVTAFLFLYFAELDPTANATSRSFVVGYQGKSIGHVNPLNDSAPGDATGYYLDNLTLAGRNWEPIQLIHNPSSALGPILNGLEYFDISPQPAPAKTLALDAMAIDGVKSSLKLGLWTGDPCLPVPHTWINCSSHGPPHIDAVDLSDYNLAGAIPPTFNDLPNLNILKLSFNNFEGPLPDLSSLKNLTVLHLQGNSLSGPLPDWLSELPLLTELYMENNNFSGSIPPGLVNRKGLRFIYQPGNPSLVYDPNRVVLAPPTASKKSNIGIIVGAAVGGIAACASLIAVTFCCCLRRKRTKRKENGEGKDGAAILNGGRGQNGNHRVPNPGGARTFSIAEINAATGNFKREIGRGGFGPVYYGQLPNGEQVAIKVLAETSNQGATEFFNEVDVLSRVHHKNLVSLIGYCSERESQMLVYEYLPAGSLRDRLNGDLQRRSFDWKTRLSVAVNAAQGLEYLHKGINPNIIHRDVKSTNILLTNTRDFAKVCDFGLSRSMLGESGSVTIIKGTRGYIDPEYVTSHFLTMKSDVYSFGMVLLELLTGRLPLESSSQSQADVTWNLADWVRTNLQGGDMDRVVDPTMKACQPNKDSLWKVAETALLSVEPQSKHRPSMTEVVQELKLALTLEEGNSGSTSSGSHHQQQQVGGPSDHSGGFLSSNDSSWPVAR